MNDKNISLKRKLLPLILTVAVFAADQITKWLITEYIPPYTIGFNFFDGILRIIHVYNTGAAFSMGDSLADVYRIALLGVLPLVVLVIVMVVYFRSEDFTYFQRWAIAGVVGGGLGNLFDRFFRSQGVVDFIDVKFYGLFGLERWPTFNVADSFVMVCAILLVISVINQMVREEKNKKAEEKK